AASRATASELERIWSLSDLAEVHWYARQPEPGLVVIAEALSAVNETSQLAFEADAYRLKGELLLALSADRADAAEACLRRAIEVRVRCQQQGSGMSRGESQQAVVLEPRYADLLVIRKDLGKEPPRFEPARSPGRRFERNQVTDQSLHASARRSPCAAEKLAR